VSARSRAYIDDNIMNDSELNASGNGTMPALETSCAHPAACPLSWVKTGIAVRIKRLEAPPEVSKRLREVGFGEQQVIKLLVRQANLICQVCNCRLALSAELAQMIFVEPLEAVRISRN
jgi:Fe2+ transport system protein FeoA